jgi:hypothetical protein
VLTESKSIQLRSLTLNRIPQIPTLTTSKDNGGGHKSKPNLTPKNRQNPREETLALRQALKKEDVEEEETFKP